MGLAVAFHFTAAVSLALCIFSLVHVLLEHRHNIRENKARHIKMGILVQVKWFHVDMHICRKKSSPSQPTEPLSHQDP